MNSTLPSRNSLAWLRLAATTAALGVGAMAFAQTTVIRDGDSSRNRTIVRTELKSGDKAFLEKAAKFSHEDVEVSRVAASRTANPEIRRFAQMLVSAHDDIHEDIGELAAAKGVNLPAKDPVSDKWVKRDGKSFDRDYIEHVVETHKDAVKAFDEQARDGHDADTVNYARKHLSKLQSHLQQALDIQRMMKARD
ncbi:MAG TPA: DUF4142 domain-containing protein [Opitutaceae bacterium]